MTDTPYNIPPLGLFGKRCRILTGYDKRPFVYRIVNSEWISNTWCEPPITYHSEKNPVRHDYRVNVLIVVLDTLVSEDSRLIRVALKDVELMDEAPTIGGWISVKDRLPETNDEVLTTYLYDNEPGKRYVETASYFDDGEGEGHWHSVWDEFSIGRVRKTTIAWMPMPKPYKPSKED